MAKQAEVTLGLVCLLQEDFLKWDGIQAKLREFDGDPPTVFKGMYDELEERGHLMVETHAVRSVVNWVTLANRYDSLEWLADLDAKARGSEVAIVEFTDGSF